MNIEHMTWSENAGWRSEPETPVLGEQAQIVLLFGAANRMRASRAFELCKQHYPKAHVLGCSTAGQIQGTDVTLDTVALTAIAFEHTPVKVARVRMNGPEDSFEAGRTLVQSLPAEGLRHVLVLSEVIQVDANQVVAGINAALPPGVTVSGGFSADGDRQQLSHIWCDGDPEQSSVAAIGLYGNRVRVGSAATGLWGQFGPLRTITKSRGNVLYELDGRSALAIYKEYLGELASALPAAGLLFPLAVSVGDTGRSVLRGLLNVDESTQSMRFAGSMPEGSEARMMMGTIERLVDDTLTAAGESMAPLGGVTPQLAILVSCNGRRHVLKQRVEEEVEAVKEVVGDGAVLTGFYSCGEIAPIGPGERAELHNETLAITTLAEV
ncbi:MAG: FIST C-terminal domain-containing protein [Acidobacteria bacterium]|nr:FIST C-terminal domain-containing protein [Acidobacteriota bacterium]